MVGLLEDFERFERELRQFCERAGGFFSERPEGAKCEIRLHGGRYVEVVTSREDEEFVTTVTIYYPHAPVIVERVLPEIRSKFVCVITDAHVQTRETPGAAVTTITGAGECTISLRRDTGELRLECRK